MATGFIQAIRERGFGFFSRTNEHERGGDTPVPERTDAMTTGIIKTIRDKGFGFIARDKATDGNDLFFHSSAVVDDGFTRLHEGQTVSFDEEADPRDSNRQRAVNVQPANSGSE